MEELDAGQLCEYLKKRGMDPGLADRLKGECINGDMFIGMSAEILRACGFKAGEIVTAMKYCNMPYESEDATAKVVAGEEISNLNDDSTSDGSNPSPSTSFDSGLRMAQDAELSEYFTPADFDELSDYDKKSMYSQLERYREALKLDVNKAEYCKPYFVKNAEATAKASVKKRRNDASNKENMEPSSMISWTSGRLRALSSATQHPESNQQILKTSGAEMRGSNFMQRTATITRTPGKSGINDEPSPSCSRTTNQPGAGMRGTNFMQRSTTITRTSGKSGTDDDEQSPSCSRIANQLQDESANAELSAESDSAEDIEDLGPPFDLSVELTLSPECLRVESMDTHLPKYDMRKILNEIYLEAKPDLKRAILTLKNSTTMIPRLERMRIIRAITLYLFNNICGGKKPSPDMKEGLAKSFVLTFNTYLLPPSKEHKKPWSLVFDRNGTGYLANSCRAPEKPFKKKRKTAKKSIPLEPGTDYDSDYVKELAALMPDRSNKTAILDAMANTFSRRNAERKRSLPVYDFIEKYPHFASFDGEVLREEFKRLHPTAKDMSAEFARLLPEMLKLPEKIPIVMDCEDEHLRALQLISQNLPHDVAKAKRGSASWGKLNQVVEIMKHGHDLEAFAASKGKPGVPIQPYIIAVKGIIGKRIARNFLVLDRKIMQLPSSTLKALDTLIKAFFVFNVCYPIGWRNTFHFLAVCFYKVFENTRKRPDAITPSEHELLSKLEGKM